MKKTKARAKTGRDTPDRRRKPEAQSVEVEAAYWQAIFSTALDAVVCIDAAGRITLFNGTAERLFGYAAAQAIGENVKCLMPSPYREQHDDYLRTYERTGVARAIGKVRHVRARRKDGVVFPIELSVTRARVGEEVVYAAIIRDATEQTLAAEALATRVRQQAVVSDLGLQALAGADLPHLMDAAVRDVARVLDVEYCKILELRSDGSLLLRAGVGWRDGLVGQALIGPNACSQASYTLQAHEPVIVEDLATERRFAEPALLVDHGVVSGMSVIIGPLERPFGVFGAHTASRRVFTADDTHFLQGAANVIAASADRIAAEAQTRKFQALAQQRERLADIGAIAADVAHDLGNPVAALSLQAELLIRRATRDPAARVGTLQGPAERIVAEARRLDRIVSEVKSFARQQRLERTAVALPEFLRRVADLWRPVARARGVSLDLDVPPDLPPLDADEDKLHRVFDNLIKNAVEAFDQPSGSILISVTRVDPDRVRICVQDSGPGIAPGIDVFRLFETTKREGSGLGLSIARQIVLAHGGELSVHERHPHGTEFCLDLPGHAGPTG